MRKRHFTATFCVVVIIFYTVSLVITQPRVGAAPIVPVPASAYASSADNCQELLARALEAVNST